VSDLPACVQAIRELRELGAVRVRIVAEDIEVEFLPLSLDAKPVRNDEVGLTEEDTYMRRALR
jgi:hypothetical protein